MALLSPWQVWLLLLAVAWCPLACGTKFQLVILHYGSLYGRFEKILTNGRVCDSPMADICVGGVAKAVTMINYYKNQDKYNKIQKTVHIFTGSVFRGSAWYQVGKQKICTEFINALNPDVMALGLDEFTEGLPALAEYLKGVTVPVLAANLNTSKSAELGAVAKDKIKPSVVLSHGRYKVAVIGFVSRDVLRLVPAGAITVGDELAAIRAEMAKLVGKGVSMFVVVGDSTYDFAQRIARQVKNVDVVVSGADVLQYNGRAPVSGPAVDPYPRMVRQAGDGPSVPVVTSGRFGIYVGRLVMQVDNKDNLVMAGGQPVLLGAGYPGDAAVLRVLERWRGRLEAARAVVVGSTSVYLRGDDETCGKRECCLGNLVADAVVEYQRVHNAGDCHQWTRAASALLHSGSITATINAPLQGGNVTRGNIMDALAYNNDWIRCTPDGSSLLGVLEYGASGHEPGAFLQLAGLKVSYDLTQPPGARVVVVRRRCQKCLVPFYDFLNETDVHHVLMPTYLSLGSMGFPLMTGCHGSGLRVAVPEVDMLEWYFRTYSPIYPEEDERIIIVKKDKNPAAPISTPFAVASACALLALLFV